MGKYKYVARFDKLDTSVKHNSCIVPVSMGQEEHEGEKFIATLKEINKHFKKCTINLCDTSYRYSIAIVADSTPEKMYNVAKREGDQWLERHIEVCKKYLTIPYEIKRWDDWVNTEEFLNYKKQVDELYVKDSEFKNLIKETAQVFCERLKNRGYLFDEETGIKNSMEFTLEECAVMCTLFAGKYEFELYPYRRIKVFKYIISKLKKDSLLLKNIVIKIDKQPIPEDILSKAALEKIINILPGHIYWKNKEGIFLGCNEKQAKNYGFKKSEDLIGKHDFNLLKGDLIKSVVENDKQIMKEKKLSSFEEEIIIKNQKKWFLSQKAPIIGDDNEVLGTVGVSLDITQQKQLEKSLRQSTQELTKALELKDRFIRNLNHEIRTPMHVLSNVLDMLKEGFANMTDEQKLMLLDMSTESMARLNSLVCNLLDISKFKEGKFSLELKTENIQKMLEEVVQEFKLSHGNIEIKKDKDTPEEIVCDKCRIQQVLRNIIMNSIKYGGQSKPITIFVSNCVKSKNKYLKISIKDEGVGIPEAEKMSVFEAFVESTRTRTNAGGTGLGLSISQEIIKSHKGEIWVEGSKEDETGTKVSFTLPVS